MKYFGIIVLALFLSSISVFSQDNSIKHSIIKGETISSIAQKYNVSIASIYKLNPNAKKKLQLKQVLIIPKSELQKNIISENLVSQQTTEFNHEVLPKETLYGITKQFKTTTELLFKANPKLETEGLKIGQSIIIPSILTPKEISNLSNANSKEIVETIASLNHQVKAKESMYSIAKQYGVALNELQNANQNIGSKGLSIGQVIHIPSNGKLVETETAVVNESLKSKEVPVVIESKPTVVNDVLITDTNKIIPIPTEVVKQEIKTDLPIQTSEIIHLVLTKETKYGIAKKYDITVAKLEEQNPAIKEKLDIGTKLTIQVPSTNNAVVNPIVNEIQTAQFEKPKDSIFAPISMANDDLIKQLIESASDKIGSRYRTGGTTTDGFDCSGLMCTTFGAFDIKLPRTSIEQSSFGEKINDVNAQKGDLIFFKTNGRSRINHVGMVVEVVGDEIKFIHSSTHSGVIISSTKEPYYQRNFAQLNRVIK